MSERLADVYRRGFRAGPDRHPGRSGQVSGETLEVLNIALSALVAARVEVEAAIDQMSAFLDPPPDDSLAGRVKATRRSFDALRLVRIGQGGQSEHANQTPAFPSPSRTALMVGGTPRNEIPDSDRGVKPSFAASTEVISPVTMTSTPSRTSKDGLRMRNAPRSIVSSKSSSPLLTRLNSSQTVTWLLKIPSVLSIRTPDLGFS